MQKWRILICGILKPSVAIKIEILINEVPSTHLIRVKSREIHTHSHTYISHYDDESLKLSATYFNENDRLL